VDGLANAENLGALVRNCVAFGVQALLVGETSCSPYLRRAVRSSMGTIMQLPLVETHQLIAALAQARVLGLRCLAAHPHAERRAITQVDFTGDCCLVFGSEGEGLSPAIRLACDAAVSIPMPPTVDSLNVASAAAVFLYEVSRQRQNV
jgi:tRNA G18 (ribose-2'-O)-methylase SpoU